MYTDLNELQTALVSELPMLEEIGKQVAKNRKECAIRIKELKEKTGLKDYMEKISKVSNSFERYNSHRGLAKFFGAMAVVTEVLISSAIFYSHQIGRGSGEILVDIAGLTVIPGMLALGALRSYLGARGEKKNFELEFGKGSFTDENYKRVQKIERQIPSSLRYPDLI